MATRRPLNKQQRQAAELLGRGMEQQLVAAKVKTSTRNLRRWSERDDFRAIVAEGAAQRASAAPSAKATLEDALGATKSDGTPDHAIRVKAALALIGQADPTPDPTRPPAQPEPTFYD